MNQEVRQEDVIFSDLEKLCASPGYIHVIAYFCFRDNTIQSGSEISVQDLLKQYSPKRLIRTEISTLIGLLSKQPIDTLIPDSNEFQGYIEKTELLLEEIHQSMINQSFGSFDFSRIVEEEINPFESGTALREAIFYGGDSAYHFQYRELALRRYTKDDNWFIHNKGYSVEQATAVISAIARIQNDKLTSVLGNLLKASSLYWK